MRPQLAAALESCFEAVLAPDLWPDATEALTETLGGLGSCFHMQGQAGDRRLLAPMSRRYRDMLTEFLAGDWRELDVRGLRGWGLARRQPVILERDVSTRAERDRSPLYQELFRRHDLEILGGVPFRASGAQWVFNVVRAEASGDFEGEEVEALAGLRPHLERLALFSEAMSGAAAAGALAAFEETGVAAVLVDWSGHVVEANPPARQVLADGCVGVVEGRLHTAWSGAQARLDRLVSEAVAPAAVGSSPGSGPVALPRPDGGVVMAEAAPLRRALADAFGRSGALILLTDPGRRPHPAPELLRQVYGLTAREADVATRLAGGDSVAEVADALGLMASSVRQLVKTIFWKTGARRQSELVAMLARLPDTR